MPTVHLLTSVGAWGQHQTRTPHNVRFTEPEQATSSEPTSDGNAQARVVAVGARSGPTIAAETAGG